MIVSPARKPVKSILINPFTRGPVLPIFFVQVIDVNEAYAEKVRAALTRKEPAIRDFFDILHARSSFGIDFMEEGFIGMVKRKLLTPGNHPIDVSDERKETLARQVNTQLRSVLRPADFESFDLEVAFGIVSKIAEKMKL